MSRSRSLNVIGAFALNLGDAIERNMAALAQRPRSEVVALVAVRQCDSFTVGWLASTLALTHSAAVRVVDRLEADRLIRRTRSSDARRVALALTKTGESLADQLIACRADTISAAVGPLDDQQLALLAGLIEASFFDAPLTEECAYRVCRLCHLEACDPCPAKILSA
jgi:DNA-binding MarR family transcriptional regulator